MAAEASTGRFRPAAAAAPPASASARVALAAAGLTVLLFGVCGVLLLLTRDYQRAAWGAGGTVAALVCLVVGFVVARRQPASPIGWLLLGWALLTPLVGVALLYAVLDYRVHHGTLPFGPVAVMAESGEFGIAVLAALTVLLFPDGRSQPLRWRWLLWIFLAASAMFTATLVAGQALAIERHPLQIGPSGAPLAVPARLQDAVDLGAIRDELANAVHAALEPAHLSVLDQGAAPLAVNKLTLGGGHSRPLSGTRASPRRAADPSLVARPTSTGPRRRGTRGRARARRPGR